MQTLKLTITKDHLEKAKATPWDTCTCIFAQAIAEHFNEPPICCHADGFLLKSGLSGNTSKRIRVVDLFDRAHGFHGDRDYSKVEAMLPCEVELETKKEQLLT